MKKHFPLFGFLIVFFMACDSNTGKVKLALSPFVVTTDHQKDLDSIKLIVFRYGQMLSDLDRKHFNHYPPKDSPEASKIFFSAKLHEIEKYLNEGLTSNSELLKRHTHYNVYDKDSLIIDDIYFRLSDSAINFRIRHAIVADTVFIHEIASPACSSDVLPYDHGEGLRYKEKLSDRWLYLIYSYIDHGPP